MKRGGASFDEGPPPGAAHRHCSLLAKGGPPSVQEGQNITYTVAAQNIGPSDAQSVTMTDPLPAGHQHRNNYEQQLLTRKRQYLDAGCRCALDHDDTDNDDTNVLEGP